MASSSFHPPFKCTKAIFVPEIYHEYESEMYDSFIDTYNLYECSKSKKGKEILKNIYEYINGVSNTSPSFCSVINPKGKVLGMNTTYLSEKIENIINGDDKSSTIMCCYDKDNDNQPYSILLYNYDVAKNSIYIVSVCADQTLLDRSKGSGALLINDLIESVSSTKKIESVFLHSVESFVTGYEKKGFRKNGKSYDSMPEMVMSFEISPDDSDDSDDSDVSDTSSIADSIISSVISTSDAESDTESDAESDIGNMNDVFIEIFNKKWVRGETLRNTTSRSKYFEKKYPDFVPKGGKKYKKTKKRICNKKKSCKNKKGYKKTKKRNYKNKKYN